MEQCGNGARCFVRFVQDKKLTDKTTVRVETMNTLLELRAQPDGRVTVDMNAPVFDTARVPFDAAGLVPREQNGFTLWPLDLPALVASVKKTGRCIVVHEATRTSGFGAELVSLVQEHCFYHLEAPIERVAGWDTPYPHALEWAYFPGPERVGAAMKRAMEA